MFSAQSRLLPGPANRFRACVLGGVPVLIALLAAPLAAQSPPNPGIPMAPGMIQPRLPFVDPSMEFGGASMEVRQAKMLNVQRQKAIVADTARILELARELDADAQSPNPVMSPAERLRKAEEIQKLAKTIREKMIYAVGVPAPTNPYGPVTRP